MPAAKHRLLVALNRIVAILSILAAILLYTGEKTLGVPGLAQAPHHEPLIVHCLLTALLLVMGNARLTGPDFVGWSGMMIRTLVWFSIAAVALINLALAARSLFALNSSTAFAILLLGPGLLCGWLFFALVARLDERSPEENKVPDPDERAGEQVLIAAAQTQAAPVLTLRANLLYGLAYIVVYGVVFLIAAVSFPYYFLIRRALFEQQFLGWLSFLQNLPTGFKALAPYFIALAVVMFGFYAWSGIAAALRERRDERQYRDINRELTPEELSVIESAANQLSEYASNFRNRWLYNLAAFLFFFLTFAAFAVFALMLSAAGWGLGARLLESARTQGLDWYLYVDDFGAGDGLTIFSAIMVSGSILSFLGTLWRNLGIAGILDYRENKKSPDDPWSYFRWAAALEVRRGLLTPQTAFDPAAFIHQDYRRFVRVWYIVTGVIVAINLAFLYLDRMDYDLLTEDYIETTDYWTSRVHRLGYGDVDRVEAACVIEDDGKDKGDLELSYILIFKDGKRRIKVIDADTPRGFRSTVRERLDAWEKADARLRAAGAPVRHSLPRGQALDATKCRKELEDYLGAEAAARVMLLLRESGNEDGGE